MRESSGVILLYNCRKLQSFSLSISDVPPPHLGRPRGPSPHLEIGRPRSRLWDDCGQEKAIEGPMREIYNEMLRKGVSSILATLNNLCWLDLSDCRSLRTLPFDLSMLKFLKGLCLGGCSNFGNFPQIKGRMENLAELILNQTAIRELPSSFENLVGLQELSLNRCTSLHIIPPSIGTLTKLSKLGLSCCKSLQTFPSSVFKLSLTELDLYGCSMLSKLPEILEPAKSFAGINLTKTAIRELPSSFENLVGLQKLSLNRCTSLEIIPPSIGRLTKLSKLDLSCCESLQTFPSSVFKLNLTELDFDGCSMLSKLPEILEPAKSFADINLTKTAIKELPSSFENLVGLRILRLIDCSDLESLPNSIVNLNLLTNLDCSGCAKLTEIPSDIGRLSSLRKLSLQMSGIVNLPQSIAHLSSLESLDISDCKNLRCIPQLPPFLKKLLALDCPSIERVMPISSIQIPSDSTKGAFKFHLTNSQHLDPSARANIVDHARLKITDNAYRSVVFHFPGSAVPHWFSCAEGHSVTINTDSLNLCNDNRIIGLALCFSFGPVDTNDIFLPYFSYKLKFESAGGIHDLPPVYYQLTDDIFRKGRKRIVDGDHTFLWKYKFNTAIMSLMPCHVLSFTFQIMHEQAVFSHLGVKECGICPLYNK
ncbi:hypothetical protein Fmac_003694 [Flemingia macrophylla]|uniref:Disease resistance protein RPS4B/Roq1-like leucine-rich repeats domain-containing protein n=1 Tax=Flemingia macrophylla TaxID=520843 RepID=A0ABD1N2S7_9FABA